MTLPSPIVFFGTPEFAVPTLAALDAAGETPIWVVSQPARRAGRGRKLEQPPVARWALEHGVELAQPKRVRDPEFVAAMHEQAPQVAVVVAFGQIFPQRLLDVPPLGCVNLHASLLPRHRGAAPIQAAIAAGEKVTGVSTMVMEAGLDSGPVLLQRRVPISDRETSEELGPRLASVGAELMVETLRGLARRSLEPTPQDDEAATYAGRIQKKDGAVDWSLPAQELFDRLRAYTPWPGLTASLSGDPLKILWAEPDAGDGGDEAPGTVVAVGAEGFTVRCGAGTALAVVRCQRPGRRSVGAAELARGEHLATGIRLE